MPIARPCLEPNCPAMATQHGRCREHYLLRQRERNAQPSRGIYRGPWRAVSANARAEQPWCSLCYAADDLTLDHTTGLVICRSCHRSEAQGGVFRAVAR